MFHWPLSELDAIPYEQLYSWQQKAAQRRVQAVGFIKEEG